MASFGFLDVTITPETREIFENLSTKGELIFFAEENISRLENELPGLDIVFTRLYRIDCSFLQRAKNIKGVVVAGVGADHIDVECASKLGIPITISPGNEKSTAEATVLLMLAVARQLPLKNKNTTSSANLLGKELFGKTLGLVGTGRVAKHVAHIAAHGLGMRVIATSPRVFEKKGKADWEPADMDKVIAESDVVSLHCPLTPSTWHLFDETRLRRMKKDAILINMARGGIIDEDALFRVLKEGHLMGAGLDVVKEEPLREDNPLLQLENVIVTPHRLTQTTESLVNQARAMCQSAIDLLQGRIPETTINVDALPRDQKQRTDDFSV